MIPIIILITVVSSPTAILSPPELTIPISTGTPGPSATIVETLFYDDGTVCGGWGIYAASGFGYHFTASAPCRIKAVGFYVMETWPTPGSRICDIRITEWDDTVPGSTYGQELWSYTPYQWNWCELVTQPFDDDGEFCVFFIFRGNYPITTLLAEDSIQEDTTPDWRIEGAAYIHGFPRNDFLLRVMVEYDPGVKEILPSKIRSVRTSTITTGIVTIQFDPPEPGQIIVSIYDLSGVEVDRIEATGDVKIDLSSFPTGVYFLKIEGSDQVVVRKVVLVR